MSLSKLLQQKILSTCHVQSERILSEKIIPAVIEPTNTYVNDEELL